MLKPFNAERRMIHLAAKEIELLIEHSTAPVAPTENYEAHDVIYHRELKSQSTVFV